MTKKKIITFTLAMTLVFGSAAALPENTFTDGAGITASAAKGDVIECDDVDIVCGASACKLTVHPEIVSSRGNVGDVGYLSHQRFLNIV